MKRKPKYTANLAKYTIIWLLMKNNPINVENINIILATHASSFQACDNPFLHVISKNIKLKNIVNDKLILYIAETPKQ